jgi:hypothetical protein
MTVMVNLVYNKVSICIGKSIFNLDTKYRKYIASFLYIFHTTKILKSPIILLYSSYIFKKTLTRVMSRNPERVSFVLRWMNRYQGVKLKSSARGPRFGPNVLPNRQNGRYEGNKI